MARETKTQRYERLAALEAQQREVEVKEYPGQLMYVLGRACELGYKLTVNLGEFSVEDHNGEFWYFTYAYSAKSLDALYSLSLQVESQFIQKEEQSRKAAVKAAALAKLSIEEKELLGL